MFFHPLLLHPQHKMQLNLPWLASTVGLKKIKKSGIIQCNISQICDFILQFLKNDSNDPNKRLSLKLAIMLIHGTVIIWREQVIHLSVDIDVYIKVQENEVKRLKHLLKESEPQIKRVVEKKKPKKRIIVHTPQSFVGDVTKRDQPEGRDLLEPLVLQELPQEETIRPARLADITLREEIPRAPGPFSDDFGEAGMIIPPPAPLDIAEPPLPPTTSLTVIVDVHAPAEPTEELQLPLPPVQTETIEDNVPAIAILPASPGEKEARIEKPIDKETIEAIVVEEVAITEKEGPLRDAVETEKEKKMDSEEEWRQFCDIQVVPAVAPPKVAKKKVKSIAAQLRLKTTKKRFAPINQKMRIYNDEEDYTDMIREITKRLPDFVPMKKFWPDWEEAIEYRAADEALMREARTTGTRGTSSSLELAAGTPSVGSLGQSLPRSSGPGFVSTPKKRPLAVDETVIEIMPPAANGILLEHPSPRKKLRKVVPIEEVAAAELPMKEIEQWIEPIEEAVQVAEAVEQPVREHPTEAATVAEVPTEEQITETEIPTWRPETESSPSRPEKERLDFGIKWSKDIMRIVDEKVRITPVDICKQLNKRVTKLNMALVFASVLALAKHRYVLLHPAADSIELEIVEKGPVEVS